MFTKTGADLGEGERGGNPLPNDMIYTALSVLEFVIINGAPPPSRILAPPLEKQLKLKQYKIYILISSAYLVVSF